MSADFQQERAWKKAAARVHSSACREHVVRVEEEKQAALLEASSEVHRRSIARRIAAEVQSWWVEVAALQKFDEQDRNSDEEIDANEWVSDPKRPTPEMRRWLHLEAFCDPREFVEPFERAMTT